MANPNVVVLSSRLVAGGGRSRDSLHYPLSPESLRDGAGDNLSICRAGGCTKAIGSSVCT